jgi:hypothetical protein
MLGCLAKPDNVKPLSEILSDKTSAKSPFNKGGFKGISNMLD